MRVSECESRSASLRVQVSECDFERTRAEGQEGRRAGGPKAQGPKAPGPKVLVFVCLYEGCRRPRAWRRARAQSAHLLLCPLRGVVMVALGRQLSSPLPYLASKSHRGVEECEHSSTFSCRFSHSVCRSFRRPRTRIKPSN